MKMKKRNPLTGRLLAKLMNCAFYGIVETYRMVNFQAFIEELVSKTEPLQGSDLRPEISVPEREGLGHFSANIALRLGKKSG